MNIFKIFKKKQRLEYVPKEIIIFHGKYFYIKGLNDDETLIMNMENTRYYHFYKPGVKFTKLSIEEQNWVRLIYGI